MASLDIHVQTFADPIISAANRYLPLVPLVLFKLLLGILIVRLTIRLLRFLLTRSRRQSWIGPSTCRASPFATACVTRR